MKYSSSQIQKPLLYSPSTTNTSKIHYAFFFCFLATLLYTFISSFLNITSQHHTHLQFLSWTKYHGKSYTQSQFQYRKHIYYRNAKIIHNYNQLNYTFQMQINHYADLSQLQSQYLLSNSINNFYIQQVNQICNLSIIQQYPNIPSQIDWSTKLNVVGPIKNQGPCSSCWAFTAISAVQAIHGIKKGYFRSFSEQNLLDCVKIGNGGCSNGGVTQFGFQYIKNYGISSDTQYPYIGKKTECKKKLNPAYFIKGCANIKSQNPAVLMRALANQPVAGAVRSDKAVFKFYKSGILNTLDCGTEINHAVLIVGYKRSESGSSDYFKVKNSWGIQWGNMGYIYISAKQTLNNSNGICGILTLNSIPVA